MSTETALAKNKDWLPRCVAYSRLYVRAALRARPFLIFDLRNLIGVSVVSPHAQQAAADKGGSMSTRTCRRGNLVFIEGTEVEQLNLVSVAGSEIGAVIAVARVDHPFASAAIGLIDEEGVLHPALGAGFSVDDLTSIIEEMREAAAK
jgi:hypothetical protein